MTGSVSPLDAVTDYENFLGRFIDAVQLGETEFTRLHHDWLGNCPQDWRDRFAGDLEEIESLVRAGAFAGVEAEPAF